MIRTEEWMDIYTTSMFGEDGLRCTRFKACDVLTTMIWDSSDYLGEV